MVKVTDNNPRWVWEHADPNRSGSSGDISKLFRNQDIEIPEIMKQEAHSNESVLMAREVTQNSWDAAREFRAGQSAGEPVPEFRLGFTFDEPTEERSAEMRKLLDLQGLSSAAAGVDRTILGLGAEDVVSDSKRPLRLLRIDETGTTGLYGPWRGAQSKMYLALVSVGYTMKAQGSGGSYGFGKAALIRGSAIRSVVAYSCFKEREDDPGVTRRLLGMTYWGQHQSASGDRTGFARLGATDKDGFVAPLENEEADAFAEALGFEVRSAKNDQQLGTSFLLVEPTVDAPELVSAFECFWWPCLMDRQQQFTIEIQDADGKVTIPRPRRRDSLAPFLRAFAVATQTQDQLGPYEKRPSFRKLEIADETLELGSIGIVADPNTWSFPGVAVSGQPSTDPRDHRSWVALIRGPRMVATYFVASSQAPFVRGVFVAHEDVDDLLRQSEPHAHDAWQTKPDEEGIDARAPLVASVILERVRSRVRAFAKELAPSPSRRDEIDLPVLDELFKPLFSASGRAGPRPAESSRRDVRMQFGSPKLAQSKPGFIRYSCVVSIGLSETFGQEAAMSSITVSYRFDEDGRPGELCELQMKPPDGFIFDGLCWNGPLTKTLCDFEVVSVPYPDDWSGRLIVNTSLSELEIDVRERAHG